VVSLANCRSTIWPFYDPFSVFSNQSCSRRQPLINADTLQAARESKEILMNELGVTYHAQGHGQRRNVSLKPAHFEWLQRFAEPLGSRSTTGQAAPRHASTLHFCEELFRCTAATTTRAMARRSPSRTGPHRLLEELIAGCGDFKATKVLTAAGVLHLARRARGAAQGARLGRAEPATSLPASRRALRPRGRDHARRREGLLGRPQRDREHPKARVA